MKILCVSDTTDSLAFSTVASDYCPDPSLIISAGDIPVESYDYLSTIYNCDTYYVYGNHCLKTFQKDMQKKNNSDYLPQFYGFNVDGKCIYNKKNNLLIAGLGGSMLYNGGQSQYSEQQMKKRITKLAASLRLNKAKYGRYLDILITHAPPFGIGDSEDLCHRGFKCFLSFIEKFSPEYLLHGHVHLPDSNAQRLHEYKGTKIINVYNSYILEYRGKNDN